MINPEDSEVGSRSGNESVLGHDISQTIPLCSNVYYQIIEVPSTALGSNSISPASSMLLASNVASVNACMPPQERTRSEDIEMVRRSHSNSA